MSEAAAGQYEMVARVYDLPGAHVETRDLSMFRPRPFPVHQHDGVFQIGFAMAGSSQVERQGRRTRMAPGQFHVINPGELHTAYGEGSAPWRFRYLNLPRATVASVFEADVSTPSDRVHDGKAISAPLSRFFDGSLGRGLEVEELLVRLVFAMRKVFGVSSRLASASPSHRGVRRALAYLRERYAEPVRLADVAAYARTSPFHLCRGFRSAMSLPPHQYLLNVRVNRAKEMLEGADALELSSVAQATGFYDQAHFVKSFKKRTGLTPSRYRKLFARRPSR